MLQHAVTTKTRHKNGWWLVLTLSLCASAYSYGLVGGFLFDDYPNIVQNDLLRAITGTHDWFVAALSSNSGILRRPVSMLSFALNIYYFGMSPLAFKIVNLLVHLANGILVFLVARRVVAYLLPNATAANNAAKVAFVATAFWMLHPLNVSGVVYIVQRMNELASLFTLMGLLCFVVGRQRTLVGQAGGLRIAIGGMIVFGLLAVFSKENGALIVAYAFVIEVFCFRFKASTAAIRHMVQGAFVLTLAVPLILLAGFLFLHPEWLTNGYYSRDFTLSDRLLTEPRILFHYLLWIFVPIPSFMGMYHDDIATSTGLLAPPGTLVALLGWVALVALAWKLRRRAPGFGFAVVWFLAGHAMESSFLPLELVFEHRNYLPMTGLLIGSVCAVSPLTQKLHPKFVASIVIAAILGLSVSTAIRNYAWGNPLRLSITMANNHPNSARSLYDAGRAVIYKAEAKGDASKARLEARKYFKKAMLIDQSYVLPAVSYILTYFGDVYVPESTIGDLTRRIRGDRSLYPNPILMLLKAVNDGQIKMQPNDVKAIVTTTLDNASLRSDAKALVLNRYGQYQYNILHDAQAAVSLTLAAVQKDKNSALLRINLANLALALGRPDIAKQALLNAKKLDVLDLNAKAIANIQGEIQRLTQPQEPKH